jgi:hypothetical protein
MRFYNNVEVRAVKATVGVDIVGCYCKCTAVQKYRIIDAGPNNCYFSETDQVYHSGVGLVGSFHWPSCF